jgi:hypothetical protein
MADQTVVIEFECDLDELEPLFALEDALEQALSNSGFGEYDGNEIATDGSHGRLFLYGPNADSLLTSIQPVIRSTTFIRNATAVLQYDLGEERRVSL